MLGSSSADEKVGPTPNEAIIEEQGYTGHEEIKTLEEALGYSALPACSEQAKDNLDTYDELGWDGPNGVKRKCDNLIRAVNTKVKNLGDVVRPQLAKRQEERELGSKDISAWLE
jgi:hypothetical protein